MVGAMGATCGTCVSIIDVGKGDCILLQVGGSAALIDTGYDQTSANVLSFICGRGVVNLDYLIITHYDRDHIGGLRAIAGALPIGAVFLPAYEGADKHYKALMSAIEGLGLKTQRVTAPLSLRLGDATVYVYPSEVAYIPDAKGDEGNDNDLSIVTSLTCGDDSFLFAGDLEKEGIKAYLSSEHGRYDVLKVPCHGKKCPCNADLLEDARPRIAVITDSADDPADKKTLKLLAKAGIDTYRTGADGTIVIEGDGAGEYTVSCHQ